MKIRETYIVQNDDDFVKLHYCTKSDGTCPRYFIEYNNGVVRRITYNEFSKLILETEDAK